MGKGELFNEMHTECKMKQLASIVNNELKKTIKSLYSWDVIFPKNDVLDMGIYTKNRAMRTIFAQKNIKSPGFQLSERSKHLDFSECFITQNVSELGKTYFDCDLPELEFSKVKTKIKHNIRIKNDDVERTVTRVKKEIQIVDHFKKDFGNDFNVKFNGAFCGCLLNTSPSPRDGLLSRMPSSA